MALTPWGPLGYVTYKRTYARRLSETNLSSKTEEFEDTIDRVVSACQKQLKVGFHRQVPISHFIIDFYCHEIMLAIEVDGSIHNTIQKKTKDIERQYHLEQLGVHFIRINDADIKRNMDSVIRFLKHRIDELTN